MKILKIYLIGYFVVVLGAGVSLWQGGLLAEIPLLWIALGALVAVGSGILLAVASMPRIFTTTRQ